MDKKKILIVEDNEINRGILKEVLIEQYDVIEAENGQAALELLRQCWDEISLILLDIVMPVMDGYAFLKEKKRIPEIAPIPVIVMTQGSSEEDEINALSYGATDFVQKPYRAKAILHRIASIINLRETSAMVHQLKYDRLTGLYSREYFCQILSEKLKRNPEKEYDLICCNIENFKLFNDAFGRAAGNRLLKEMADYFQSRKHESVVLGRYQSDRFVWLVERHPVYRNESFQRLNQAICLLSEAQNLNFKWGIYRIKDRTIPVEQMCDRAMLAVNSVKGQYFKLFAVYDERMRSRLLQEQELVESMEPALENDEFQIYFQPKYSLIDDQMVGAEALVRWENPEKGLIGPGKFIPLFEKNGFITRMDCYVWEQVCQSLSQWKQQGYPILPISVNISRADFYQVNLSEILLQLIEKYNLEPKDLHLEITESAYMEDPRHIMRSVEKLRKCGFVVELDDFGSGFSSLNMMNQMELDVVKLDRKFIQSEMLKSTDQGILRFVVNLVHWKRLKVVAEGIETREELERVKMLGCDIAQGYLFSEPLKKEDYEKLLKTLSYGEIALAEQVAEESRHEQYILLIDDDPAYRELVKETFGNEFQLLYAENAQEVLACLGGREMLISAMILSMTLPGGKSEEILKLLRDYRELWMIPILATGPYEAELEKRALQLGADGYAGKSGDGFVLERRIDRLLGLISYDKKRYQLQSEVFQDYLTGLLNRRGLSTAFRTLSEEDLPLAVYFFDLDNLKEINDQFGHETGDRIIKMFAEYLRQMTRNTDIVARYGGDEFVVILKHIPSEQFVLNKGNEICEAFNSVQIGEGVFAASSAGVALCENGEKPTMKLLKHADQALYLAKAEHKGKCCMWNAGGCYDDGKRVILEDWKL